MCICTGKEKYTCPRYEVSIVKPMVRRRIHRCHWQWQQQRQHMTGNSWLYWAKNIPFPLKYLEGKYFLNLTALHCLRPGWNSVTVWDRMKIRLKQWVTIWGPRLVQLLHKRSLCVVKMEKVLITDVNLDKISQCCYIHTTVYVNLCTDFAAKQSQCVETCSLFVSCLWIKLFQEPSFLCIMFHFRFMEGWIDA